ncbi:MAG: hypothetical protein ACFFAU_13975 [Candidatus Hodarchaeota archaeon]
MIKRFNMNKGLMIILILGILLLSSPTRVSASTVWEDTFEEWPDDWEFIGLQGYTVYYDLFTPNFTILDGALAAPYQADWDNTTFAFHNSTVPYGTWSFDLFFPPDMIYQFIIILMLSSSDGNCVPSFGMTEEQYLQKLTGYGLLFRGGTSNPRIFMTTYLNNYPPEGSTEHLLVNRLSGSHHFDITRNQSNGQFYVYHNRDNNTPIISYRNNYTTSSEKFGFVSWVGAPRIDNITVSNSVDIDEPIITTTTTETSSNPVTTSLNGSTPGFSNLLLIITPFTLIYLYRRRKKGSNSSKYLNRIKS